MGAMTALAVIKAVSKHGKKILPMVKSFACSKCDTIAAITVTKGAIGIVRCRCRQPTPQGATPKKPFCQQLNDNDFVIINLLNRLDKQKLICL